MNEDMTDSNTSWFYIKHSSTEKVIACCTSDIKKGNCARSQVVVIKSQYTDNELWCWDNHCLRNKATGLVLDIRKGRLRLIEDTEICVYFKKPSEESHNQLWAVRSADRDDTEPTSPSEYSLDRSRRIGQPFLGVIIYSLCNNDWVLDISCPEYSDENSTEVNYKLILLPQHQHENPDKLWEFVSEHDVLNISDDSLMTEEPNLIFDENALESSTIDDNLTTPGSSISCESLGFAHGLTPAKRGSETSLKSLARKESLEDMYIYQTHRHHQFYNR